MRSARSSLILSLLIGLSAAGLGGCAHRAVFKSEPVTASVYVGDELVGQTPVSIRKTLWPFRRVQVTLEAPGYRTVTVPMHDDVRTLRPLGDFLLLRWRQMVGIKPRRVHTVVFIKEHGASGTWTPEDAQDTD